MSSLQMGLWILGGLVVLGVWLYNRWLTRRLQPKRSIAPESTALEPGEATREGGLPSLDERLDPVMDGPTTEAMAPSVTAGKPAVLDPMLDTMVPLSLEHGVVSGDAVLAALPGTRRVGSKSFVVEGLNIALDAWEAPRAGQRYNALRAGIQLASRAGALNDIEFSEFVVKVQGFADVVGAAPEFPEMLDEVTRARELDQFASAHDAQLGFTLRARRASWSPGYLNQHAAACGFVAGALPGRMVLPSDVPGAPPVLVLQYETQLALAEDPEQVALREFHLTLDVPHVAREERPFVRMREMAQRFADTMEGVVTDGSRPLGPDDLDRIGSELEVLYDALTERGLPAGAPLTRRLFN